MTVEIYKIKDGVSQTLFAEHNDELHNTSAKRDAANGISGLDGSGNIIAPGNSIKLTRDGSNFCLLYDRTSGQWGIGYERVGSNDFKCWIQESTGLKRIQTDSMKNVANGILGLNASKQIEHTYFAITTKTTSYTATDSDSVILCDATSAAFTVTLPTAVGISGRLYTLKKIDSGANAVTVDGAGAETIDGAATYSLESQYDIVRIVSDGANWMVI